MERIMGKLKVVQHVCMFKMVASTTYINLKPVFSDAQYGCAISESVGTAQEWFFTYKKLLLSDSVLLNCFPW